ncbi:MAG: prolipoprotein diacylglyceryl transferase [Dehalococcoidia bacterium]|nr:prolipoprotein diacylglyceryl transferase [Dehalococcoidia bacterium]
MAFAVGGYEVRWYILMLSMAILLPPVIFAVLARKEGMGWAHIFRLSVWWIAVGLIGARLFYLLENWQFFMGHTDKIFGLAGERMYGGILGVILVSWVYSRIAGLSFLRISDLIIPGGVLAMVIARIGCTLNGCCYGEACDLPWAIVYTAPDSRAPLHTPIHPFQIYQILWFAVMAVVIWTLLGKTHITGLVTLTYWVMLAVGDLLTRFLRADEPKEWGISQAQVIDILILLIIIVWAIVRKVSSGRLRDGAQAA